jgi:bidirectional [NiFe] hydrogenase diaphorase subunit
MGTACLSCHSDKIKESLTDAVNQRGAQDNVAVSSGGCQGLCAAGPMVLVEPTSTLYHGVTPEDAPAIIDSLDAQPVERLRLPTDTPFFTRQKRLSFRIRAS